MFSYCYNEFCDECNGRCVLFEGIEPTCTMCGLVQQNRIGSQFVQSFQTMHNEPIRTTFSKSISDVIELFHEKLNISTDFLEYIAESNIKYLKNIKSFDKRVQAFSVFLSYETDKRAEDIISIVLDIIYVPSLNWVYHDVNHVVDLSKDSNYVKSHMTNILVKVMKIHRETTHKYDGFEGNKLFMKERSCLSHNCFRLFNMLETNAPDYIYKVKTRQLCIGLCYMASKNAKLHIKVKTFTDTGLITSQILHSIEKNVVQILKLRK